MLKNGMPDTTFNEIDRQWVRGVVMELSQAVVNNKFALASYRPSTNLSQAGEFVSNNAYSVFSATMIPGTYTFDIVDTAASSGHSFMVGRAISGDRVETPLTYYSTYTSGPDIVAHHTVTIKESGYYYIAVRTGSVTKINGVTVGFMTTLNGTSQVVTNATGDAPTVVQEVTADV